MFKFFNISYKEPLFLFEISKIMNTFILNYLLFPNHNAN